MELFQYWRVFLEVAIMWYVIYMALLFVKGTNSEQLLKGLFLIGLLYLIAQQLNLESISWALTRLFPISVVALVVIFQPELRRALSQLGQFGIHEKNVEVIDEITKAAASLAKRKIGALIVIEREVGLKSFIETGIPVDGNVNHYLLVSTFVPTSPLHDGAVIVQRGKLVAAGCILPLSQDERVLPKSYGMRHRAAIGISEETDAVAVVVSEETGGVSIAVGGKFIQNLDEEALARSLKNLFHKHVNPKGVLRKAGHLRFGSGKKQG